MSELIQAETIVNPIKKSRKLTLKQKMFAREYVRNRGNGTQAALKVYGEGIGKKHGTDHPDRVAENIGSTNLSKPIVRAEIDRQLELAGLSDGFLDRSAKTLIDAGVGNAQLAKPKDAIALIQMMNKLKDRFPASKRLSAHLELSGALREKRIDELAEILKESNQINLKLLNRVQKQLVAS